jgi:hypothetical protein
MSDVITKVATRQPHGEQILHHAAATGSGPNREHQAPGETTLPNTRQANPDNRRRPVRLRHAQPLEARRAVHSFIEIVGGHRVPGRL